MVNTQTPHGNQSRRFAGYASTLLSHGRPITRAASDWVSTTRRAFTSAFCSTLLKAHSSCLEKLLCTLLKDLVAMVVGDTSSRDRSVFDPYDPILTDANPCPAPMMSPRSARFRAGERLFKHRRLFIVVQYDPPGHWDFSKGPPGTGKEVLSRFPNQCFGKRDVRRLMDGCAAEEYYDRESNDHFQKRHCAA